MRIVSTNLYTALATIFIEVVNTGVESSDGLWCIGGVVIMRGHEVPKRGQTGEGGQVSDWETIERMCRADNIHPYKPMVTLLKSRGRTR